MEPRDVFKVALGPGVSFAPLPLMLSLVLGLALTAMPQKEMTMDIESQLIAMAKDEMAIVERLAFLRQATEKLPETWKSEVSALYQQTLTKQQLLSQISEMELSAADRWSLLLNNLAQARTAETKLTASAREWRASLQQLPALHRQINDKLNEFNERLKAGILMNIARKFQSQVSLGSSESSP